MVYIGEEEKERTRQEMQGSSMGFTRLEIFLELRVLAYISLTILKLQIPYSWDILGFYSLVVLQNNNFFFFFIRDFLSKLNSNFSKKYSNETIKKKRIGTFINQSISTVKHTTSK